jgi:hypothetical protein
MKQTTIVILAVLLAVSLIGCGKKQSEQVAEKALGVRTDKETSQRLEEFLGIPIYPGAKLADIFTERRDDQIPEVRMDATAKLIIDDYAKVPPFYEKELGLTFTVEGSENEKYYTLTFDKGEWQYEIYVGHDTYMNKPCYDIRMWKKEQ